MAYQVEMLRKELYEAYGRNRNYHVKAEDVKHLLPDVYKRQQMMGLCPERAHILYGYPNCGHHFQDGRCVNCYWDCLLYTS